MMIRKFKIVFSIFLLLICLTMLLPSCSHAVEFTKDQATYNGEVYDLYSIMSPDHSMWFPLPSKDRVKMVDRTAFWPVGATSYDPILATNEEPANFLIICADGANEVSKDHAVVLIRSDIELPSIFETAFSSVTVTYDKDVEDSDKYFDNFSDGTTFDDIVGADPYIMYSSPKEWDYYCTLTCTHPELDYLICEFHVIRANDNYYLRVDSEPLESVYYLLNFSE